MTAEDNESALRKELGRTLRAARLMAGLLQRELAHKIGYSRSRVAGAEAGDYVSQQFCERCDEVLGTSLKQGYDVVRKLRMERLLTSLEVEPGGNGSREFWEGCGERADSSGQQMLGYEEIRARSATAAEECLSGPNPESEDPRVKVVIGVISGVWHIEIHMPNGEPSVDSRRQHPAGNEGKAMTD
jgi:transcriptional regulator with XRE-family HTH domain